MKRNKTENITFRSAALQLLSNTIIILSSLMEIEVLSDTNVGKLRCLFGVMEHKNTACWYTLQMIKLKQRGIHFLRC